MIAQPPMSTGSLRASRPLSPGQVALIGTVHMDLSSFPALVALLMDLRPHTIATEMSNFGTAFRRTKGRLIAARVRRFLRQNGEGGTHESELGALLTLMRFPFEYLAARTAARRLGVPLVNLGRDRDSIAWLARLGRDTWNDEKLACLATIRRDLRAECAAECRRARCADLRRIHHSALSAIGCGVSDSMLPAQFSPAPADAGQAACRLGTADCRLETADCRLEIADCRLLVRPGPRDRLYARGIAQIAERGESMAAVLGWEHVAGGVSGNVAWILRNLGIMVWLVVQGETYLIG